jgi:hypothetical protein
MKISPSSKALVIPALAAGIALLGLGLWHFLPAAPQPQMATSPPMPDAADPAGYAGSWSCRECHEKFYQLWAPSHHGLAMQPVTPEFLKTKLEPQINAITVKDHGYQAVFRDGQGFVREQGPEGEKNYPMAHAMGGKNVHYFLTPLEKGRLQVLPVAYDVRQRNGSKPPPA